jgi:hypothetical protein
LSRETNASAGKAWCGKALRIRRTPASVQVLTLAAKKADVLAVPFSVDFLFAKLRSGSRS